MSFKQYQGSGCKLKDENINEIPNELQNRINDSQQKNQVDFYKNVEVSKSQTNSFPSSLNGQNDLLENVTPPGIQYVINKDEYQGVDVILFPDKPIKEQQNYRYLYEFWPSYNQIFFKGRLFTGPKGDRYHNLFTWIMIIGISTCFFVIVAPYIWSNWHWLYVFIVILLFTSTIAFLALTQFSDPGIIPRKEILEMSELHLQFIHKEEIKTEGTGGCPDKKKKFQQNKKQQICTTCNILKPARSSHCKDCGNCVQVFDHHCPFVNNCIGQRNYKYFIAFLISLLLLALGELGGFFILFIGNIREGVSGKEGILIENQTILVIILFVLGIPTILLTLCVLILACYHFCLMYTGKTTREQIKKKTSDGNLDTVTPTTVWCAKVQSLFNLRQKISIQKVQKFLSR